MDKQARRSEDPLADIVDTHENDESGDEAATGAYANYFEVGHNPAEFLLVFGQLFPPAKRVRCHTRIVATPTHAKILSRMLWQSVGDYEKVFGEIPTEET